MYVARIAAVLWVCTFPHPPLHFLFFPLMSTVEFTHVLLPPQLHHPHRHKHAYRLHNLPLHPPRPSHHRPHRLPPHLPILHFSMIVCLLFPTFAFSHRDLSSPPTNPTSPLYTTITMPSMLIYAPSYALGIGAAPLDSTRRGI